MVVYGIRYSKWGVGDQFRNRYLGIYPFEHARAIISSLAANIAQNIVVLRCIRPACVGYKARVEMDFKFLKPLQYKIT